MNRLQKTIASAAIVTVTAAASHAADVRSYVAGNFALNLDGAKAGFVRSVEGGAISADVVNEPDTAKKHIGNVKYEEISFKAGFSQGKPMLDWISDTFDKKHIRKNGSIVAGDFNYKTLTTMAFTEALITEVTIPACDGASKDPAYMSIKIAPDVLNVKDGGGKQDVGANNEKQKLWLPANFRLNIPGVDCKTVRKIEAFTIKQKAPSNASGEFRDNGKEPASVEYPNLTISMPLSGAQSWIEWHQNFVIKGSNDDSQEKDGTLSFLSADQKEELAKVTLHHAGIFRLERDFSSDSGTPLVKVELYVESMEIDFMAQFEK